MNVLLKYLGKQIFITNLGILLSLVLVIWLSQSLRYIEVINQGASFNTFLSLMMLMTPRYLVYIIPICCFISCYITYNRYHNDREIEVMQSLGFTPNQILYPAFFIGILSSILVFILYTVVIPISYSSFRTLQLTLRYDVSSMILQPSKFNHLSSNLSIYISSIDQDGRMYGIFIDNKSSDYRHISYGAKEGVMLKEDGVNKIMIFNGSSQIYDKNNKSIKTAYFSRLVLNLSTVYNRSYKRNIKVTERSMEDLFHSLLFAELSPEDKVVYSGELNKRIFNSFTPLIYSLWAGFCVLFSPFVRGSKKKANTVSVVMFTSFLMTNLLAMAQSSGSFIWIAIFDLLIIFELIALFVYLRIKLL